MYPISSQIGGARRQLTALALGAMLAATASIAIPLHAYAQSGSNPGEDAIDVYIAQGDLGTYLVGPDGNVNLRKYDYVRITGKTVEEARVAIQKHLGQFFDAPEVTVEIVATNSKVYYVIFTGGDGEIVRMPATRKGTVLDALSQVAGPSRLSERKVWISRRSKNQQEIKLPVDFKAILRGDTSTNHQLMPDDRLFVSRISGAWYSIITHTEESGTDSSGVLIIEDVTVRDVLNKLGDSLNLDGKEIWLLRPGPEDQSSVQLLPVDWAVVAKDAASAMNYPIRSGDALFAVEEGRIVLETVREVMRARTEKRLLPDP